MNSLLPAAVILTIVLLVIGCYVGAYLGAGCRVDWKTPSGAIGTIERTYTHKWAIIGFAPATWAETKLRGVQVQAVCVSSQYQRRLQKLRDSSVPASQAATVPGP